VREESSRVVRETTTTTIHALNDDDAVVVVASLDDERRLSKTRRLRDATAVDGGDRDAVGVVMSVVEQCGAVDNKQKQLFRRVLKKYARRCY
jgi:vacuolar-type H+-ATPase subunit E/Vma4